MKRIVKNGSFDSVIKCHRGWKKNKLRDLTILRLLYDLGLRTGEVNNIRTEWIDLENRRITILDSKKRTLNTLPISRKLCEILKEYLGGALGSDQNGFLFPSYGDKGYIGRRMVQYIVKRWTDDWHPRTFRRRLSRLWVIRKGALTDLQRILRHKRFSSTAAYIDGIRFEEEEEQFQKEYERIISGEEEQASGINYVQNR